MKRCGSVDKVINRMVVVEAWNHQGPYLESVVNEEIDQAGTVPENEDCNMVKLFQFQLNWIESIPSLYDFVPIITSSFPKLLGLQMKLFLMNPILGQNHRIDQKLKIHLNLILVNSVLHILVVLLRPFEFEDWILQVPSVSLLAEF